MKNAGTALRKAYYTKLNGQITVRGAVVPVLAADELVSAKPYIMLTGQTGNDISGKGAWSDDRTILVDIVTSSAEGIAGPAESEDIATQVCELIAPTDTADWPDVGPDFKMTTLQKISENDLVEGSATETVYRKLLRFRHQIHEL